MTLFIVAVVIILFIVLLKPTITQLNEFETKNKVIICITLILIVIIITSIIFGISSIGIEYGNQVAKSKIRNMLIAVFTPINCMVYMPYLAKKLNKLKLEEISKEELKKKIINLLIIAVIIYFVEMLYMKNIQTGILNIAINIKK